MRKDEEKNDQIARNLKTKNGNFISDNNNNNKKHIEQRMQTKKKWFQFKNARCRQSIGSNNLDIAFNS